MTKVYQKYLFLLMIYIPIWGFVQSDPGYMVKGVVKDANTGETLPFASVFFASTTYGTVSDENGNFVIAASKPGTYSLVVSYSGYSTFFQQVDLNKPQEIILEVTLNPKVRDLGNVVVTAKKDEKWYSDLQMFKDVFLGTSSFAQSCKILNEEVMNFYLDPETQVFEAFASEPLIVVNDALGYEIKYLLEDFRISYKNDISTYYGYRSFKDLNKESKRPKKRWIRKRDEAFLGSTSHFFRALYAGKVEEEGFVVNRGMDIEKLGRTIDSVPVDMSQLVSQLADGTTKTLKFDNFLYINYLREDETEEYRAFQGLRPVFDLENRQQSWIYIPPGSKGIGFEKSGYIINPLSIIEAGYWGFEKLGDALPIDYEPQRN